MKTHLSKKARAKKQQGFTLVEISFSMVLLVVATGILFTMMEISTRLFARIMSVSIVEYNGRRALEDVSNVMEQAVSGFRFLDAAGNTLPQGSLGGFGVTFEVWPTINTNIAEDNEPVLMSVRVVDNEIRLYEGGFTPGATEFRVISDQVAAYTPDEFNPHSWPFHRGSFPNELRFIDLNFKFRARDYDRYLSQIGELDDVENPNTYFHVRALVGARS
ncbi:MAG: PilW family protein [Verrucomicrobiales bacterium]